MSTLLDDMLGRVENLSGDAREALTADLLIKHGDKKWIPNPGPQTEAYFCKADQLFYGGQGGGGKTDLLCGLALNEHRRSLIVRLQYSDMGALIERMIEINGTRKGFNGAPPPTLRTSDKRLISFGALGQPDSEHHWQGHAQDFYGFEEAAQLNESRVRFVMGWLRSTTVGQRKRVVFASNPPLSSEGEWLVEMFAPWLDENHPNPAKPGELRWFATDEYGKDFEVEDNTPMLIDDKMQEPISRTFIPAALSDNPYLAGTGYKRTLDAMPEPIRSAIRDGNFAASRPDHPRQMIPSDWIRQAQARWKPGPPPNIPMCAIAADVAQGGLDNTVLSCRYDGWYAPLVIEPGRNTPYGSDVAALIIKHRRGEAEIIIDMGGGYGGAALEHLVGQNFEVYAYKGGETATARTSDRKLGFFNKRAQAYWKFREALDPDQPGGSPIMLPESTRLRAQLAAVTWELPPRGIQALTKEDVTKKLGHSPDEADAVVMAWFQGAKMVTHRQIWNQEEQGTNRSNMPKVVSGRDHSPLSRGRNK